MSIDLNQLPDSPHNLYLYTYIMLVLFITQNVVFLCVYKKLYIFLLIMCSAGYIILDRLD